MMEEFIPKNTAKINNMPTLPYAIEEAVNRLRVNISFLGSEVKKIMVISSMPDEGKSFVSMQLWRQMAEANVRSILLDMDLRKSVAVDKYQIEQEKGKILGMSYYLANDASLEECVLRTDIGKGDILPNVDNVVNPSMLLEGHKFERTLKELENYYRYIFIDSPPLNLVSDGEKIGSLCDGAILVVRAGETSKSIVRNSIRQLERANCPLIGIVLSRAQAGNGGYYSKKYGGYYGKKYYGSKYYGSKSNYYYGYGVQK
ncbi:MAG: CpsD/CapB family tyrosine-protein kinase [Lachnospiraceae bacterium]|nr:CpsD/CapB family tyrosine-protein kinase [Lachnospiraceae bacterium]